MLHPLKMYSRHCRRKSNRSVLNFWFRIIVQGAFILDASIFSMLRKYCSSATDSEFRHCSISENVLKWLNGVMVCIF